MLSKIIPLVIAVAGVSKNMDKIKKMVQATNIPAVQSEMSNICKVIHLDSIDGSVPSTDPALFAEYVKKNLTSQQRGLIRDFSKDMWGTSYRLEIKNNVATVISAGPDKQYDTKDDLRASTDLF